MEKLKKIWQWISTHTRLVLLFIVIVLLSILVLWWGRKNRRIKALENELAVMNARLSVERITLAYNTKMDELAALKAKDDNVRGQLDKIQKSLEERLKPDMTAEEIAAKFRAIGLPQ